MIVGSNRQSIDAAAKKAKALGYRPIILSTTIDGETREIARMHAALAREMMARGGSRACFLSGGETTVTIRGKGLGGTQSGIRAGDCHRSGVYSQSDDLQRRHGWHRRTYRRRRADRRRFHTAARRRASPRSGAVLSEQRLLSFF